MTELIVDNFAGGGGASTGIWMALGRKRALALAAGAKEITMRQAGAMMMFRRRGARSRASGRAFIRERRMSARA